MNKGNPSAYIIYAARMYRTAKNTIDTNGKRRCLVRVYDLLQLSGDDKITFFNNVFSINARISSILGTKVVLYIDR